jgi:thiol:disulfide interchange protein DsbD
MRAFLLAGLFVMGLSASPLNPVKWTLSAEQTSVAPSGSTLLKLHADIEPGYHLYSVTTPAGGPISTRLRVSGGATASEIYQPEPETRLDPTFNLKVETFTNSVDFLIPARVATGRQGDVAISVSVRYQACSDEICLPPVERKADVIVHVGPQTPAIPAGYRKVKITQ